MPARNEVLATTKLDIPSPVSRATVPNGGSIGPSLMLVLPPAAFDPTVLDRVTRSRPGNQGHGVTTETTETTETTATVAIPNVAHGPVLPDETGEPAAGRARALIVLPAVTRLRARRAKAESPRTRHHRARLGRTIAELAHRSARSQRDPKTASTRPRATDARVCRRVTVRRVARASNVDLAN
jgi:hypothetical protein